MGTFELNPGMEPTTVGWSNAIITQPGFSTVLRKINMSVQSNSLCDLQYEDSYSAKCGEFIRSRPKQLLSLNEKQLCLLPNGIYASTNVSIASFLKGPSIYHVDNLGGGSMEKFHTCPRGEPGGSGVRFLS